MDDDESSPSETLDRGHVEQMALTFGRQAGERGVNRTGETWPQYLHGGRGCKQKSGSGDCRRMTGGAVRNLPPEKKRPAPAATGHGAEHPPKVREKDSTDEDRTQDVRGRREDRRRMDGEGMSDMPAVGWHHDQPMDEYLALPCMSASGLEEMRRSPLQFQHWLAQPKTDTAATIIGTALHTAVLEPEKFDATYVQGIDGDGRTKAVKEAREALQAEHPNAIILAGPMGKVGERYIDVLGMRDAILSHPRARTLFEGKGEIELTGVFDDPETGVRCKIRPDRLIERAAMLVDIKKAFDASPFGFPRAAEGFGYFRKLALYHRGLRALDWNRESTAIVAVEPAPPYDLLCYLVDEDDLAHAQDEVTRLLVRYRDCMESDTWPGYAGPMDGFTLLKRPAWAKEMTA